MFRGHLLLILDTPMQAIDMNNYRSKIEQDCPSCGNSVLAVRINGFYAGSRNRIFLWECPLCAHIWRNVRPKVKAVLLELEGERNGPSS